MSDTRTEELRADAQAYVDRLSATSGVTFDDATAHLLRRVYMEGRAEGVAWCQTLIGKTAL